MNRMTVSVTAAALLLALSAAASAQDSKVQESTQGPPSATISFSGGTIAVGIGYSWVHGILHFNGMDYPFAANGLSLANVGAVSLTGSGNVYGLDKVEDFPGVYTGIGAGATIGVGGGAVALQNQNSVVLQVTAMTQGLQFAVAGSGISLALSGPPVPSFPLAGSSTPKQ